MAYSIANGFDRAIGTTVPISPYGTGGNAVVGTAPPVNSVIISSGAGIGIYMEEDTDSPTIERGVQCTAQHKFTYTYFQDALDVLGVLSMGTILQDSDGNVWRLLTASLQSMPEGKGKLVTVCESISFDTPPDEFQVNSVDMGIDIIKHPRYFLNLYPTTAEFETLTGQVKEAIIRAIQTYRDCPFFPTAANLYGLLNGQVQDIQVSALKNGGWVITVPNTNYQPQLDFVPDPTIQNGTGAIIPPPVAVGTGSGSAVQTGYVNDPTIHVSVNAIALSSPSILLAMAAAQEIITKLWRMEDSPYAAAIELKWSQYYFLPPLLNLGSYIEDPTEIVPDYFLKPDRPITELPPRGGETYPVAGSDNIFTANAAANPQDYSSTGKRAGPVQISWLRKSDEIEYQRTWFKITSTWVGSEIGYFDPQIYGATERPAVPSDYVTFS